jgi:hypothetical protein
VQFVHFMFWSIRWVLLPVSLAGRSAACSCDSFIATTMPYGSNARYADGFHFGKQCDARDAAHDESNLRQLRAWWQRFRTDSREPAKAIALAMENPRQR